MNMRKAVVVGVVLAGLLLMLQSPLRMVAQDQPPQDQVQPQQDQGQPPQAQGPAQDPPGRVARLSFSDGSVSFQPGGEGDWVQAVPNRPLTTGDNIWADKDSRAELQAGSSSIRMDSETSVTFLDIDDHTTQLKLSQGSIIVRVRHLDDDDAFEIDTPNLAFQIQRTGEYRVDVSADGNETDTTVWSGRGEATGGGNTYDVIAGQRASFTGTDQLDHEIAQIPEKDDFDNFAFQRDDRDDHAESTNYVSPDMTGASDLDEYGHWSYAAGYGPVWAPAGVAPGWAPYRYGHWVWVAPWGWTWVEDEPWGFAPFHYGRWAFVGSSWCWVPGPVSARPVYAPALVAFVGGGGFSVGVGVGAGVAWFPLAPREVFVPWYRTSPGYVNNVNVTNTRVTVTQVTNVYNTTIINNNTSNVTRVTYANQHVANAVTAVSHDTFVNARPVQGNLAQVNQKEIENAPVMRNVPVQPSRASVMGAGRPATARPSTTVINRQVVAVRQPPPPRAPLGQGHVAEPNVRTEAPKPAQPAARTPNESTRPAPSSPAEPAQRSTPPPAAPNNQAAHTQPPAAANNHPAAPASVPHPPAPNGHPLVRPAPPVQESPQHQQNEQNKFNTWQQQRQAAPPRPAPKPQSQPPRPPHEEKH